MNLSLGFSPCPNDTFIFDALVNEKLDLQGHQFTPYIADVEELNRKAFEGELDITKLSYHAYTYVADRYQLLRSGSALGRNCGPLLISKNSIPELQENIKDLKIAIPGKFTTANFLLSIAFPEAQNKYELIFSEIENAVLTGEADAGLIIHENRFTYEQKGLKKLIDLGEYWEETTGYPIPLGGIAINRKLPLGVRQKVEFLLQKSVKFAMAHPDQTMDYVRKYAQEMDKKVMMQHIELYVNDFSVDLGKKGTAAVEKLYEIAQNKNIIPDRLKNIFVEKSANQQV